MFLARPMVPNTDAYDRFSLKSVVGRNLNAGGTITALDILCSEAILQSATFGLALLNAGNGQCKGRPI